MEYDALSFCKNENEDMYAGRWNETGGLDREHAYGQTPPVGDFSRVFLRKNRLGKSLKGG